MHADLRTTRLSLHCLTPDDHAFMRELVNTAGWLRFIGDRQVYSAAAAQAYIGRILGSPDLTYWVVRLRETALPIGIVTLLKRTYLPHFDIGFALLPAYAGHGYAYEATSHVLARVRQQPAHAVVLATTLADNTASRKLLRKLGLRFERELSLDPLPQPVQVYRLGPPGDGQS